MYVCEPHPYVDESMRTYELYEFTNSLTPLWSVHDVLGFQFEYAYLSLTQASFEVGHRPIILIVICSCVFLI